MKTLKDYIEMQESVVAYGLAGLAAGAAIVAGANYAAYKGAKVLTKVTDKWNARQDAKWNAEREKKNKLENKKLRLKNKAKFLVADQRKAEKRYVKTGKPYGKK